VLLSALSLVRYSKVLELLSFRQFDHLRVFSQPIIGDDKISPPGPALESKMARSEV
jgi:hypothetical protein